MISKMPISKEFLWFVGLAYDVTACHSSGNTYPGKHSIIIKLILLPLTPINKIMPTYHRGIIAALLCYIYLT